MKLNSDQKSALLEDLNKNMGIILFDFELEKLLSIFEKHTESFSKKISKGNMKDTPFKAHGVDVTDAEQRRMTGERVKVFDVMRDGKWRTLDEIRVFVRNSPPQSIAIYLRSFREHQYGGMTVNRRKRGNTRLFEYQVC